jgi:hypothetical protein
MEGRNGREGPTVVGLPLMTERNEDVKVEKTKPLEREEGIGGVVRDERGEEEEGGVVIEWEGERVVETMDEDGGVEVAEVKPVLETMMVVVREATAPFVEVPPCELAALNKGQIY